MANFLLRVSASFVDAKGFYGHMRFYESVDSNNNAATLNGNLIAALINCTNAAWNGGSGAGVPPGTPGTLGTQATFGSIEDKALLTYVSADGVIHRFQLPAPKDAIFLADKMTVDVANTNIVALNSVILNAGAHPYFLSSRGQSPINTFIGGVRIRRRNQRRINIFTRNPDETGPDE